MVSTRLQSNSSSSCGDGGSYVPSCAEISSSKGTACGVSKERIPLPMVSTRLQCGDGGSTPTLCTAELAVAKGTYNMGCATRSSTTVIASQVATVAAAAAAAAAAANTVTGHSKGTNFLDLPTEIVQKIVSYLGFRTVANLRTVNKKMDQVCGSLLNSTFNKLQNNMLARFHSIKAQMPRRESARRQHPLACEFDIIETIYMRLNLLHMTFGKHIEKKLIYFFPGEVLDEVYRILYYIKVTPKLPRPYRVTDELFDLTTMAMEYFKEKLEPNLPEVTYCGSDLINYSRKAASATPNNSKVLFDESLAMEFTSISDEESNTTSSYPPQSNMVLRKRIRKIKQGMKLYNSQLTTMKRELKGYKTKMADQQKTILDYATRLDENDKKNEEMSRKYSTLLQELNKCKTELQYWRSKSPLNPICGTCGAPVATLPIEDLEALSNQGVVIPMVVVQPIDAGTEEENVSEKNELEEIIPKEPNSELLCSRDKEEIPSSSKEATSTVQVDNNGESPATSESDSSSSIIRQYSTIRPAKRKQVSDKQQTYKKQRGILKLRSKTIRIMK